MRLYSFERLEVWQLSRQLVKTIYKLTGNFPTTEQFGITAQMRKAAISVPSNIAEGTSRRSRKDKKRFLEIAYGSLIELLNQVIIATDLEFLEEQEYESIRPQFEEISNKINALSASYDR